MVAWNHKVSHDIAQHWGVLGKVLGKLGVPLTATALAADCSHLICFADSTYGMGALVDPTLHSGQDSSLAACSALHKWFAADPQVSVTLWHIPSKVEWSICQDAHKWKCSTGGSGIRTLHSWKAIGSHFWSWWALVASLSNPQPWREGCDTSFCSLALICWWPGHAEPQSVMPPLGNTDCASIQQIVGACPAPWKLVITYFPCTCRPCAKKTRSHPSHQGRFLSSVRGVCLSPWMGGILSEWWAWCSLSSRRLAPGAGWVWPGLVHVEGELWPERTFMMNWHQLALRLGDLLCWHFQTGLGWAWVLITLHLSGGLWWIDIIKWRGGA